MSRKRTPAPAPHPALPCDQLRWCCDPAVFAFDSTAEVPPIEGVIGQDVAIEALRFGLEVNAPGQNIFVRGLTGTGRSTLLQRLLESIRPDVPRAPDRLYVHNFAEPDRPRLITLPRGQGTAFRAKVEDFVQFIREELKNALASEVVRGRTAGLERRTNERLEAIGKPFDEELRAAGLALVQVQVGPVTRPLIVPLIDGEPASPERLEQLRRDGKLTDEDLEQLKAKIGEFSQRLQALGERIAEVQGQGRDEYRRLLQEEARSLLEQLARPIRRTFPDARVQAFIDAVIKDVVEHRLGKLEEDTEFTRRYEVNPIQSHDDSEKVPVVIENAPSIATLVGTVDLAVGREESVVAPHAMVRAGSLLRADGGYLILEARDVLMNAGAWRVLIRTLRTGSLEMVPPDLPVPWRMPLVTPEPIPIHVKVVLLGDAQLYYLLDAVDPDFPQLFKVLADFDSVITRNETTLGFYAGWLSRLCREEALPAFHRTALAALTEHGARIAAQPNRLTVRFGRLADIAREAAYLAVRGGQGQVGADHVREAVKRTKRRADLPARRFRERIADGTLRIGTRGKAVGQINGLAVITAGPLTYGFPQRITATIGPGSAGVINIEREAELSGAIHTKGFFILGGLLRGLLRTDHPIAFEASVAFEQSYGGIDGDSASGAEIVCLLSALTGIPLRQDLAMTGAIDQLGNILPVGAANEKIEGFFDACRDADGGLTGTQGVVIPARNVGDLMLREDVVEACRDDRFHVWPVDLIQDALEVVTDLPAGVRGKDGRYPAASVLGQAVRRARHFWQLAVQGAGGNPEATAEGARS